MTLKVTDVLEFITNSRCIQTFNRLLDCRNLKLSLQNYRDTFFIFVGSARGGPLLSAYLGLFNSYSSKMDQRILRLLQQIEPFEKLSQSVEKYF